MPRGAQVPPHVDSTRETDLSPSFNSTCSVPSRPYEGHVQDQEVAKIRDQEYPQLRFKTYLDHAGTTLYAKSLIDEFAADLVSNLYGNPHSASTPSAIAGERVDSIRARALRFFNADPNDFDLIFVPNATGAIRLVVDCLRDHAAVNHTPLWYGYHQDSHTSLVGARECTASHRCFTSDEEVDTWISSSGGPRPRGLGLFAYPGQSNMTGRRLPLSWPGRIRSSPYTSTTYSLLDAAALAATAPIDLTDVANAPDFVVLSFYKIFGYPNIGALIVRKSSSHVLQDRSFFGGGTVEMVVAVGSTWHAKKDASTHDRLEDGTLPFHAIFALDHAMNVHERLYGPDPMRTISRHTAWLSGRLYKGLSRMRHANGRLICRIYKDQNAIYGDSSLQGSTVAFNIQQPDGRLVGFADVEKAADQRDIYLRSGSLCNPGGFATYLEWTPAQMRAAYAAGHRCSKPVQIMLGKATGVVRISLGAMSTAADVDIFLRFIEETYGSAAFSEAKPDSVWSARRQSEADDIDRSSHLELPPALSTASSVTSRAARSTAAESVDDEKIWNYADEVLGDVDWPRIPPLVLTEYIKSQKQQSNQTRQDPTTCSVVECEMCEMDSIDLDPRDRISKRRVRRLASGLANLPWRTTSHDRAVRAKASYSD